MDTWLDLLTDSRGLRAVYGSSPPPLGPVDLWQIDLGRNGPTAALRFDLAVLPEPMPQKWARQGSNVIQITLVLIEVESLSLTDWQRSTRINLGMQRAGDHIRTTIGKDEIVSRWASVTTISAHRSEA